jgi:high-affinity nickel permease
MGASLGFVLFSCAFLGFRHGFDYDHIAAITDIAGVKAGMSATMRLGLMYALGHAATVAVLGSVVIGFKLALPEGLDRWAERLVGLTLILLAIYVLMTLVRKRGRELPKSRAAMLIAAGGWMHWKLQTWITGVSTQRRKAQSDVGASTCFGIGIIHGLGAETPSQLALFLLAANLGGMGRGFLGLGFFLLGLLVMNTLMTASAAGVFRVGQTWSGWPPILTGLTAAYSMGIGIVFLFGHASLLKNISG